LQSFAATPSSPAFWSSWKEQHGYGDNVCGPLPWASCNEPVAGGNWPGCAAALITHGLPSAETDPDGGDGVIINGRRKWFSDEVTDV